MIFIKHFLDLEAGQEKKTLTVSIIEILPGSTPKDDIDRIFGTVFASSLVLQCNTFHKHETLATPFSCKEKK